ncbi:MAG: pyridoxal-phosphate dependent enzyme [Bacteroidota bacterium]
MVGEINNVPTADQLIQAATRIRPFVNKTPVFTSNTLNHLLEAEVFLKCENFQKVGAFKARGAMNAILQLTPLERQAGVATHSSGNHAQALSWGASILEIPAYIVMPANSSRVKVNDVKDYGGQVTFCEPTLEARESTLEKILKEKKATEIHPYNNFNIICGQSTATIELLDEIANLDIVMAPVGGGGLLSGTSLAVHYFSPGTKVIAAEPENASDAFQSFYSQKFIPSVNPDTIADGLRTSLGSLTFPIILKYVDEIVTVSEPSIIHATRWIWERMKILIEPSSAVTVAALLEGKINIEGKRVALIISGGNVDLDHLPW